MNEMESHERNRIVENRRFDVVLKEGEKQPLYVVLRKKAATTS
jgi:hypothetical protein